MVQIQLAHHQYEHAIDHNATYSAYRGLSLEGSWIFDGDEL